MAEFPLGARPTKTRGTTLVKYLLDGLTEADKATGRPIRAIWAEKIIERALDPKTNTREFILLSELVMSYESGKPVNTNLNADITENPFEGIDTAKLEALRAKLLEPTPDGK